jgi:aminopeptidase-like protein
MDKAVWRAALLPVLLACAALAQDAGLQTVERQRVDARLNRVAPKDARRVKILRELFQQAGCGGDCLTIQPVEKKRLPNLVCSAPGTTDSVIVVGAHVDHAAIGRGAVDNWTGAALLPSLFEALHAQPRRHTFLFVGFTAEEVGLVGSRSFVQHLTGEQRTKVRAMVNVDSLGLSPTKVWHSHADPLLTDMLSEVAASMQVPLEVMDVEKYGSADSESFRDLHIPSITLHSVTLPTMPILHSRRDQLQAVNRDEYYQSFRLLAAYLAYLDRNLN